MLPKCQENPQYDEGAKNSSPPYHYVWEEKESKALPSYLPYLQVDTKLR